LHPVRGLLAGRVALTVFASPVLGMPTGADRERSDRIVIDGVQVSPEANISTNIEFLPLDGAGTRLAAALEFSMTAAEVDPACRRMRAAGFEIGCLYNQETSEHPQLYFSHMLAVGEPQDLAFKIRKALNHTRSD